MRSPRIGDLVYARYLLTCYEDVVKRGTSGELPKDIADEMHFRRVGR